MERREVLALVASVVAAGCTANRATRPEETPTDSSQRPVSPEETTGSSSWGYIHVDNQTQQEVTYEITVKDIDSSTESVRLSDTETLSRDVDDGNSPSNKSWKKYSDIPLLASSHTHRISVRVTGGPSGSKEIIPSNGYDWIVSFRNGTIEIYPVTEGAAPTAVSTSES